MKDLAGIVGVDAVTNEAGQLSRYAQDFSLQPPKQPGCIVYPRDAEQVREIMRYADQQLVAVTTRSSGVGFYGAGIPAEGGIVLDLSPMNRILEVDRNNKRAKLQPGVTWEQAQRELGKQGLFVSNPLLPHRLKSVLTSSLEREPLLSTKSEYGETFITSEMVLANGDLFWTGTGISKGMVGQSFPDCLVPGTRLFMGAQGTLGIQTWANIKIEYLPIKNKIVLIPFKDIDDMVAPIYRLQRLLIGNECFVLNHLDMASILAEKWPDDFKELRQSLPPWLLVICLTGMKRLPEEKIAAEEEALMEIAREFHLEPAPAVAAISGLEDKILAWLRLPWPGETYWKFRYRGGRQDVFFHTTLDRVPGLVKAVEEEAVKHNYPAGDIGIYLQPIERAHACFCQFGFHYNPSDSDEVERLRKLFLAASERVMDMGGLFTTPYGPWADMVYSRADTYKSVMKVIKDAVDPNHILNPGRLCL
ncbi:MAG: FAD-binding oxidoreductase [Chloroflexota bacterium]